MAKFTKFLGQIGQGLFGSRGDMSDYQHAARLFTDNVHRLGPKVEFLYHVYLDINDSVIRSPLRQYGFNRTESKIETGLLVKNFNLPGVSVMTETKNQYGKKTNIQTAIQYQPVTLTFHDDNAGLIGGLWEQYFKSQYADSEYIDFLKAEPTYNTETEETRAVGPGGRYRETTTTSTKQTGIKFGFDNYKTARFFNEIKLYQLSRHRFFEFTLINPMVQNWTPPTMNSSSSNPAENQMSIIYEGIRYSTGRIDTESVKGFTALHYDNTPSPLGGAGGGLFGQGGVLAGGLDVVGDVLEGNIFTDPLALLGTAIKAKNTYDKAQQLSSDGIKNEVRGIVTNSVTNAVNQTVRISGIDKLDQNQATVGNVNVQTRVFNPNNDVQPEASEGAEIPSSQNSNT